MYCVTVESLVIFDSRIAICNENAERFETSLIRDQEPETMAR
ncbi:uncharacterized protein RAG0_07795 [Rhynchosporium agropyri]|uniref:Uncharacterized protein n=1 Tax=Rhynchosporium agropyri TaxID=914238 RepID=A0A1E1KN58_9HELO|nr:uncharacterized protein RAG0_07795 [Rhynchosporium agropyri]